MEKYIPLNKKSKKEQKKFHAMQRVTWGMNPVTRTVPNGKGYDRNRQKKEDRQNSREFRNKMNDLLFSFYAYHHFRKESRCSVYAAWESRCRLPVQLSGCFRQSSGRGRLMSGIPRRVFLHPCETR